MDLPMKDNEQIPSKVKVTEQFNHISRRIRLRHLYLEVTFTKLLLTISGPS
jgi:hypothetical protein